MKRKYFFSIERLHLIAGYCLVISGILVYFMEGFEMALSWAIFGAMYISMSDVGEYEMTEGKRNHASHLTRRLFGYIGAILGLILVLFYLCRLIL